MPEHCCYLLVSDRHPRHTYVGYTVNAARRLRQHNGELRGGARATSMRRPWRHLAIVRGFPTARAALQFEWALKHPRRSRTVRECIAGNAVNGPLGRLWVMHRMLSVAPWAHLQLQITTFPLEGEGRHQQQHRRRRLPLTIAQLRRFLHWVQWHSDHSGSNVAEAVAPQLATVRAVLERYDAAPTAAARTAIAAAWRTAVEAHASGSASSSPAPGPAPPSPPGRVAAEAVGEGEPPTPERGGAAAAAASTDVDDGNTAD